MSEASGKEKGLAARIVGAFPGWRAPTVAATAILVYLNALGNGFAFDDDWVIAQNERVHQLSDLAAIWLTPYWENYGELLGLYRPLTIFGFAVQWALGDGSPLLFHAVNVVLHGAVSLLVYLLLRELVSRSAALVGGLVFAVHPVHTEVVANVVGQAELLVALSVMGAALLHVRRPPGPGIGRIRTYALAVIFLLGFLAKEHAVVLPGLLVLLDLHQRRLRLEGGSVRRYLRANAFPGLVLFAVVLGVLALRLDVLGSVTGGDANPALPYLRGEHRLLSAFRAWPEYVRLLFYPADLAVDYSPGVILPVEGWTPMAAVGLGLLLATVGLALGIGRVPGVGLAAGWFLVAILPVSNLLFPIGTLVGERTLYVPSFSVALVAGLLWSAGRRRAEDRGSRIAIAGLFAVALAAMAARTWIRNPDWASSESILVALYRDHPESYRAQWRQAVRAVERGDTAAAASHWELGYRLWPEDPEYTAQYGVFEMTRGRPGRAVELLERAVALEPIDTRYWRTLALAYRKAGRPADALAATDTVLSRIPSDPFALRMRALAQMSLGRPERAVASWRAELRMLERIGKREWDAWMFLADALAQAGRWDAALAVLDTARSRSGLSEGAAAALDTTAARIRMAREGGGEVPFPAVPDTVEMPAATGLVAPDEGAKRGTSDPPPPPP